MKYFNIMQIYNRTFWLHPQNSCCASPGLSSWGILGTVTHVLETSLGQTKIWKEFFFFFPTTPINLMAELEQRKRKGDSNESDRAKGALREGSLWATRTEWLGTIAMCFFWLRESLDRRRRTIQRHRWHAGKSEREKSVSGKTTEYHLHKEHKKCV